MSKELKLPEFSIEVYLEKSLDLLHHIASSQDETISAESFDCFLQDRQANNLILGYFLGLGYSADTFRTINDMLDEYDAPVKETLQGVFDKKFNKSLTVH